MLLIRTVLPEAFAAADAASCALKRAAKTASADSLRFTMSADSSGPTEEVGEAELLPFVGALLAVLSAQGAVC